jgi:hypothetical protein
LCGLRAGGAEADEIRAARMIKKKTTRRFEASEQTVYRDLRATIIKMNALSLKVDYDLLGNDASVRIYFDRNGKRYMSQCGEWEHFLDNLRAAQLAIEYTYRIAESYGANFNEVKGRGQDLFDRVFVALEAPLDPNVLLLGTGSEWWTVMGLSRTATKAEIVNAYRALAKVHHPDVGGDVEQFKRLRAAYEAALKERER